MPSRGEFSTNPVMLADLTATAGEVFTTALERTLDSKTSPALEGKPLSAIQLSIVHGNLRPVSETPAIIAEELGVRTINKGDLEFLDRRRSFEDLPQDVKDRYKSISDNIATVALSSGLQVARVMPMEAVQADYTAYTGDGTMYEVKTLDPRPIKRIIASGKEFAREALEYVQSDDFEKPFYATPMGPHERIIWLGEGNAKIDRSDLMHHFGFDLTAPDLPLNGFEPPEFLQSYRQTMLDAYQSRQGYLQAIQAMGGYDDYIDTMKQHITLYEQAIKRVEAILESKKH